jgi:hypothetical protein
MAGIAVLVADGFYRVLERSAYRIDISATPCDIRSVPEGATSVVFLLAPFVAAYR